MMKKKFMGIVIGAMLIMTFFAVGIPAQIKISNKLLPTSLPASSQADVPVWEQGDTWTYQIDNVTLIVNETGKLFELYLTINDLPLTVSGVDATTYSLDYATTMSGHAKIKTDLGDGLIDALITFNNVKISGNIIRDKSTLGVKSISTVFSGRFWINVIQQPYIPFKIPTLPFKITINTTSEFSTPFTMLSFPLDTGTFWNLTATNLTVNGEMRSLWFYFIHFFNSIKEFLPPEIDALLPVVNVKAALDTLGTGNVFNVPMIPGAFFCLNTESVTVPAGPYDAYNITIMNGTARCFYAPAAGNIIKLTGNIQDLIPFITNVNMELKSTNFS